MTPDYMIDYDSFLKTFQEKEVSGAEVGEMVARMAAYYARYNLTLTGAQKMYNNTVVQHLAQTDASGKAISATKAESLAAASEEHEAYARAKVHVQNLEQYINALKSLQKGLLYEYSTQG